MKIDKSILRNTPEYESYSENEVKLTKRELMELGILKCGGCCSKNKLTIVKNNKK